MKKETCYVLGRYGYFEILRIARYTLSMPARMRLMPSLRFS